MYKMELIDMYKYPNPQPYYPRPVFTEAYIKQNEKRNLRKKSNGIGFYIFSYSIVMEVFAVILILAFSIAGIDLNTNHTAEYLLDIAVSVGSAFVPGLIYIIASGYNLRESFGKTCVSPTLLIPITLMGMGASMVANYAAVLFDSNISIFGLKNYAGLIQTDILTAPEIILYTVAVAVVPAFAEEFAFRGILMGSLKKYGKAFAVLMSAVMFGAMHANTTQIVFAFILGLIFGYVDIIADSIVPSVILHFVNNFYAILTEIISSNTNFDQNTVYIIQAAIMLMFCISGLLSFVYLSFKDRKFFRISSSEKSEYYYADILTFKEKIEAFLLNPGVITALSLFLAKTIIYLIPSA